MVAPNAITAEPGMTSPMKTAFEELPPEKQAEVREVAERTSREYGFNEKEHAAFLELCGIPAQRTTGEPT